MKSQDRKAFVEVVLGFAELKGKQLTAPALELYWRSLQHWELDDFKGAAEHLLRTCEFMPLPKDFEDLRKAGRPTAGEAWAEIRAIARHSYTGEPNDPIAARALRALGGMRAIAMCDSDKVHFLERRFVEHYEAMSDADDVRESVPAIANEGIRLLAEQKRIGRR